MWVAATMSKPSSASRALYEALDPSQQQIRVLKILPNSSTEEPIACELQVATLDAAVKEHQFSALSYVWGDAQVTRPIRVNGHVVNVTVNLQAALCQFRDDPPEDLWKPTRWSGWLWVDAICINQMDNEEKSHQVRLMGEVYCRATRVLSWLGTPREGLPYFNPGSFAEILLDYSKDDGISEGMQLLKRIPSELRSSRDTSPLEFLLKRPDLWVLDLLERLNRAWVGLDNLANTKYWKRLWILQEIWLADPSGHVIIWGQSSVTRHQLMEFDTWIQGADLKNIPQPQEIPEAAWVWIRQAADTLRGNLHPLFPEKNRQLQGISMPTIMAVQGLRCSDPRDVIFALLAITKIDITIDYNKKPSDVYVQYATTLWSSAENPSDANIYFSLSGIGLADTDKCEGLPSWVPNFHTLWKTKSIAVKGLAMQKVLPCEGSPMPCLADRTFRCRGVSVAVVSDILSRWTEDTPAKEDNNTSLAASFCVYAHRCEQLSSTAHKRLDPMLSFARLVMECEETLSLLGSEEELSWIIWDEMIQNFRIKKYLETQRMVSTGMTIPEISAIEDVLARTEQKTKDARAGLAESEARMACRAVLGTWNKRALFEMQTHHFGIGPRYLETGDHICVFEGATEPVVLRRKETFWVHVGMCYVPDLDDFVAGKMTEELASSIEEFVIQ